MAASFSTLRNCFQVHPPHTRCSSGVTLGFPLAQANGLFLVCVLDLSEASDLIENPFPPAVAFGTNIPPNFSFSSNDTFLASSAGLSPLLLFFPSGHFSLL